MAESLYDQLQPAYQQISYSYQDVPELTEFFLKNFRKTGKRLGSGAFGVMEELTLGGTFYAGKTLHSTLLDAHNEGIDRVIHLRVQVDVASSPSEYHPIYGFVLVSQQCSSTFSHGEARSQVLGTYTDLPLPLPVRILKDIVARVD